MGNGERMVELNTYHFRDSTGDHDELEVREVPRHVYTVAELADKLAYYVERDCGHLPVHILDMSPEEYSPLKAGLVTDVELDIMEYEQGLVLDIMSWPDRK